MKRQMLQRKITDALNALSSKKPAKYTMYLTAVIIFFILILIPPILGILIKWGSLQQILDQPQLIERTLKAVANSFIIALLVSALDVLAGIPMAWLITRGKSKWLSILDTLADVPFIVPTAALGYSLLLFWNKPEGISALFGGSLVSTGWLLVILLHFTFSYPVVVRVLVGALLDYKREYEQAARTLGAAPFIAFRTVTSPILKPSFIAAFVLALARSLSETGATFMIAGDFENGPVFLQNMKNEFAIVSPAIYEGATVFASIILIIVSCVLFALIQMFGPKLKLPFKGIWPIAERKLSYKKAEVPRNTVTLVIFIAVVLLPSLFVALPAFQAVFSETLVAAFAGTGLWSNFWQSLLLSYGVGAIVTVLGFILGLPMAILIARKRFGKMIAALMDILVAVPLIVPSIALGVSLKFFWKESLPFMPEIFLLIFAHLAITYPYIVKAMAAAFERVGMDIEDAARTLGAKPFRLFTSIIMPLTKYSIFSGAVMVFTRSVSETGATIAVVTNLRTAPVVIVDWVKGAVPASSLDIGLGCGLLVLLSFVILFMLRLFTREKRRH
ncbi:MAG: ABC transporter permease subunit [Candidatus Bathyarchaeia archaeon]